MERECYEEEVQLYRKIEYQPIIITQFYEFINVLTSGLDLAFDNWPHFLFPIKLLFSIRLILVLCVTICRYLLYVCLYYLAYDSSFLKLS